MLFNTLLFWCFFLLVLGLYSVLAHKAQNRMLLVASLVFYGCWDARFLSLILASTVIDYFVGGRIAASEDQARRKRWLMLSLVSNLGLLGFFKYFNFFVESAQGLLQTAGIAAEGTWTLSIILPVGISFYTFQTLSYTIDIYRRELEPVEDFFDFALFVSFFPQLVAGPIERAATLLPQIHKPREVRLKDWREGTTLIVIGLFKKVAVADLAAGLVNQAFGDPGNYSGATLLMGLYLFSMQIYADFSGYSDIARGLARMLGFNLMENFRQPYHSASITEFWRRWHISLSTWLRDYVYIPLGGNRDGRAGTYRNLMLTMLIGGLWHGAAWNFVIWGGLHGLYLAGHKRFLEWRGKTRPPKALWKRYGLRLLKIIAVFHLVALTWIFFRADSFDDALTYLSRVLSMASGPDLAHFKGSALRRVFWSIGILLCLVDIPQDWSGKHTTIADWWPPAKIAAFTILALALIKAETMSHAFIYFQF